MPMTKFRFIDIVINATILSDTQRNSFLFKMLVKMYKLRNKIETTILLVKLTRQEQ